MLRNVALRGRDRQNLLGRLCIMEEIHFLSVYKLAFTLDGISRNRTQSICQGGGDVRAHVSSVSGCSGQLSHAGLDL